MLQYDVYAIFYISGWSICGIIVRSKITFDIVIHTCIIRQSYYCTKSNPRPIYAIVICITRARVRACRVCVCRACTCVLCVMSVRACVCACVHTYMYICMYAVVSSHLVCYNKQESDMQLFRYYNILLSFFVLTSYLSSCSGGACKIQMICVCFSFFLPFFK
jgi:hypothetical protein